jgi:hypothetical protein
MKDLSIVRFLMILLIINKISNFNIENTLQSSLKSSKLSLDDVIHYLSDSEDKKEENNPVTNLNEISLLEKKAEFSERGRGCESMNKCSGKGSCSNGSCVCDEGFDYFDCSVNVLSKI